MAQMIFVNIPVADVARSRKFYESLGFSVNEKFSGETGNCVVVSEHIYLMTLRRDFFAGFTPLPVADPAKTTATLIALSRDDRAAVDAIMTSALANGGTEPRPAQDHGFMYQRTFADPDGNMFEPFWMDPAAAAG